MPISHHAHARLQAPKAKPVQRRQPTAPAAQPVARRQPPAMGADTTEALIRAVAAEARGESPAVWTAVAQCIINYARKTKASIPRLVRTSYLSSNFDGNRRYYQMPLAKIPHEAAIRRSVEDALAQRSPIGDRSHFHDTSIRTPSWGNQQTKLQIGRVVFYNPR